MEHAHSQQTISHAWRELSLTLFALRNALVQLSLLLHDLQFEMDQQERDKAEAEFRTVFERLRADPSSDEFDGPR